MCDEAQRTKDLLERIRQLGDKSTQVLLFLSFVFVAVVTLKSNKTIAESQQHALTVAIRWWVGALLPILVGVFPVRDFFECAKNKVCWYNLIRWFKVVLLIAAVFLILIGAVYFACGIWPAGYTANIHSQ
jgi:hypothetical protein